MSTTSDTIAALDNAIKLVILEVGMDATKQTIVDRIEIVLARMVADAEMTAKLGQIPPG